GPARRPARRTTLSHRVTSLGIRSRAMRVFPVRGKGMAVHAKRFFARRRVIHRSCGEQTLRALLASMNNSGGTISLGVAVTRYRRSLVAKSLWYRDTRLN